MRTFSLCRIGAKISTQTLLSFLSTRRAFGGVRPSGALPYRPMLSSGWFAAIRHRRRWPVFVVNVISTPWVRSWVETSASLSMVERTFHVPAYSHKRKGVFSVAGMSLRARSPRPLLVPVSMMFAHSDPSLRWRRSSCG
jgi:hypothetical protein